MFGTVFSSENAPGGGIEGGTPGEHMSPRNSCESLDQDLESAVEDLLSFYGSEHLLRAAKLDVLMQGMGRIFASSGGTEATYELSAMAGRIEYFVSHNWRVSRVVKFVALAFKFNLNDAVIAAILTMIVCFALSWLRWLPSWRTDGFDYNTDILCRLCLPSIVLVAFFFGRTCHRRASGPSVFLDKVCIHQVDASLQQQGISKLGAFIRSSDHMLVLYSSIYCRRLWTVYEVASFLTMHDVKQLQLIPLMLPLAYVLILSGQVVYNWTLVIIQVMGLPGYFVGLNGLVGSTVYAVSMRLWAKSRAELLRTLRNFSVYDAECAVESDRQIIFTNIIALMKASKKVKRNASAEETLEAFNLCVRRDLAEQFDKLFGKFGFAFSTTEYILVCLVIFGPTYVDRLSWWAQGMPFQEVAASQALVMFYTFTYLNVLFLILEVFMGQFLHLNRFWEIIWCASVPAIFVGIPETLRSVAFNTVLRLHEEKVWLVVVWVAQVFTTAATIWVLQKVSSQHRQSPRPSPLPALAPGRSTSASTSTRGSGRACDPEDVELGEDSDSLQKCEHLVLETDIDNAQNQDFLLEGHLAQVSFL